MVFDRPLTATWTVLISGDAPIEVYEADGVTPVDVIDFGVTTLDFFGNAPIPTHPVVVKNHSQTVLQIIVTGDLRDDVLPLFGPTHGELRDAPSNAFFLQPQGISGDITTGLLGLALRPPTSGDKTSTIIFRATDAGQAPAGPGRIAFHSGRDGNLEIYVMNADGSNQTRLTTNAADDRHADWSPDGHRIAFSSMRDGNSDIYVMTGDGSGQTNMTFWPYYDDHAAWSPEGSRIAWTRVTSDGADTEIVFATNGGNRMNLTSNGRPDESSAWSPDGNRVAFARQLLDGNWDIYVVSADRSSETRLTDNPAMDKHPDWSPDGGRIAFSSDRDGNTGIYVMNADGSNQARVSAGTGDFPAWSPDGSEIAFASDRDGNLEIYIVGADGSNERRITNNPAEDSWPSWTRSVVTP